MIRGDTAWFSLKMDTLRGTHELLRRPGRGHVNNYRDQNNNCKPCKPFRVHYLPAKSLGSHASVLVSMLNPDKVNLKDEKMAAIADRLAKEHKKIKLSKEEMVRLTTWVDCNGQYYGTYYGRKNLKYKDHPNFRPHQTVEQAQGLLPPIPEDKR